MAGPGSSVAPVQKPSQFRDLLEKWCFKERGCAWMLLCDSDRTYCAKQSEFLRDIPLALTMLVAQ